MFLKEKNSWFCGSVRTSAFKREVRRSADRVLNPSRTMPKTCSIAFRLLLNFNTPHIKQGIIRVVTHFPLRVLPSLRVKLPNICYEGEPDSARSRNVCNWDVWRFPIFFCLTSFLVRKPPRQSAATFAPITNHDGNPVESAIF